MLNKNQRELIVKLWEQKKKQQEIALLIGCSQPTVQFWIQRHKKGMSLKTLPRSGRPTLLTKKNLAKLKREFTRRAKEANENYCSIDVPQFSQIITEKTGKKYTPRHVKRILHKLDFSRITPRPKHIKNDPKRVKKFREEFKKKPRQNMWVMRLSQ